MNEFVWNIFRNKSFCPTRYRKYFYKSEFTSTRIRPSWHTSQGKCLSVSVYPAGPLRRAKCRGGRSRVKDASRHYGAACRRFFHKSAQILSDCGSFSFYGVALVSSIFTTYSLLLHQPHLRRHFTRVARAVCKCAKSIETDGKEHILSTGFRW